MKLSVIVCIYNTKKEYLAECLASIRAEVLPDYEIIIVDDGSDVDYSALARLYGARLERTENRGLLAARLRGIEISRGDYIAFADSDDTVSSCYHLPMLIAAEQTGADIVMNGWAFRTRGGCRCVDDLTARGMLTLRGEDILRTFCGSEGRDHSVYVQWNKLFSRKLMMRTLERLRATDIPDMHLTYGEDMLMNFYNFSDAERLTVISSGFYLYRSHSEQCTRSAALSVQIDSAGFIFRAMERELRTHADKEELLRGISAWRSMLSRSHYALARSGGHRELYEKIRRAYGVEELRMPLQGDSRVYLHAELLGENFPEIDSALTALFLTEGDVTVSVREDCRYVRRIIDCYDRLLLRRTELRPDADIKIPGRRIKRLHLIIHSPAVSSLGARLIKKGSRLRAFLKERL